MAEKDEIDWSRCPMVEVNPRVQSGAPVLRGTRMPVHAIVDNFDHGLSVAEISQLVRSHGNVIAARGSTRLWPGS